MDNQNATTRFTFTSSALPEETFLAVRFTGHEALSTLYAFTVDLVSPDKGVDLARVLHSPATFTIKRPGGDLPFHGILKSFEQRHEFDGQYFYRAVLAPKLWWLTLTRHQSVFLDQDIASIMAKALKDGGLGANDVEFRLHGDYPPREYVCQYGETHYDFFSRWLEHYGMYYFFEQTGQGAKCIVTDTKISHGILSGHDTVEYVQPSALEDATARENVYDFRMRRELTPNKVALKDYNYRAPQVDLTAEAESRPYGSGETYFYGEHYRSPSEGKKLAKVRLEELTCSMNRVSGQSYAPFLRPGYTFSLKRHPRSSFNQEYLTTSIHHHGFQSRFGTVGLGQAQAPGEREGVYRNAFTAIPANVQFRPAPRTPRAVIGGSMNARVDAGGSGTYAELDAQGRYKIELPFDLDDRPDGKASAFVRMAQPYGGAGFGLHFPLRKETEAVVTFVDGNPDRPIISGAAPNPDNKSQVSSDTQTSCRLTTAGGNRMHIEDQQDTQRLLFTSGNNFMRIGAFNDPDFSDTMQGVADWMKNAGDKIEEGLDWFFNNYFSKNGIVISSSDWFKFTCQHKWSNVIGERFRSTLGWETQMRLAHREEFSNGIHWVFVGNKTECKTVKESLTYFKNKITGVKNYFTGQHTDSSTQETRTAAQALQSAAQKSRSSTAATSLALSRTRMAGQRNRVAGSENDVIQARTNLSGQKTEICQSKTQTALSSQQLAGQHAGLSQSTIESTAQATKMAGQKTVLCQMYTKSAANIVKMNTQQTETGATNTTL